MGKEKFSDFPDKKTEFLLRRSALLQEKAVVEDYLKEYGRKLSSYKDLSRSEYESPFDDPSLGPLLEEQGRIYYELEHLQGQKGDEWQDYFTDLKEKDEKEAYLDSRLEEINSVLKVHPGYRALEHCKAEGDEMENILDHLKKNKS